MKGWKVGLMLFVLIQGYGTKGSDPICGFPGTPAYGYVKPDEAAYYEGDIVSYSCRVGYILLGSHIRKCTKDGSWTDEVPICDDSMTTLGFASSTPAVLGHSAELAIDRDKNTCTYLKQKNPRWWRIDLGAEYKVLSVAVTVPSPDKNMKFTVYVIGIQGTTASYHRCASFSGKFGTQTVVLSCAEGKGIEGGKVHIEDHQLNERLFELCEVEVQVEKDTGYDCGRPSRNIYSITFDSSGDSVEYGCIRGYEIVGSDYRMCENSGQWSGEPPVCRPIICNRLIAPENGLVEVIQGNRSTPLEGATVAYRCEEGFKLVGSFTRECLRDGSWSGNDPQCKAIRCPIPDGKLQRGIYRLVNKTNSMGSMAMLRCKRGKREGDNPYITCTEDGSWTKAEAHCILPAGASYEVKEEPRIVNQGAVIFGMVVAAVMIVVVLVALYLYSQKRRNAEKPKIPSRFQDPPAPPPRPPPRTKSNPFKNAIMGFMSRDTAVKDEDIELKNWKTHSLPTDNSFANDMGDPNSPKKLRSFGGSLRQEDKPAVIEVEVLSHEGSGNKGKFRSVPEENENASLENVELHDEEKESNKGSEREPKSGAEYAAVDYEKKRQSRLLKEQDSMESSSTAAASPIPADEVDKHVSPSPPKSLSHTESEEESEEVSSEEKEDEDQINKEEEERKAKEDEEKKAKEKEERKVKEEEERKAKEEEEKKAKEEAEKKAKEAENEAAIARRRKLRTEPPPPVDEKPVLRRFRR
ncbi:E-selectin-like [Uloborus diversus]|uniref:E-selectin-like n=1 Tax=Uloborus diversus TaxID=327109 RepID=UPI002409C7B1|nr:E-selectin-like [Uloborus diversus]